MPLSQPDSPALLLIDIQQGFDDIAYWGGERNNPDAETNAAKLLARWRQLGLPVFHIQHCSITPGSRLAPHQPGHDFKELVRPQAGEPVVPKNVNSSFIGTDLQAQLQTRGLRTLVIAGLTTDHCVSTTTRMAGNFGFETYLVADACATFCKKSLTGETFSAELIHQTALASLNGEFATVLTTADVLARLETNAAPATVVGA